MATKIATLKPATSLANAISVWSFGSNHPGICIAEEDEDGCALIAEAIVLNAAEEDALCTLLINRRSQHLKDKTAEHYRNRKEEK